MARYRVISSLNPRHVSVADVIFVTEDRPHETFRREGSDLHMTVDIFLREALTGTVITVNTVDDRTLRIPITSIVTYENLFCFAKANIAKLHPVPSVSTALCLFRFYIRISRKLIRSLNCLSTIIFLHKTGM